MTEATLETLRADFDEQTDAIVDAMENCIKQRYTDIREKTRIDDIDNFLRLMHQQPVDQATRISSFLFGGFRIHFDPFLQTEWDKHSDRCRDCALGCRDWPGEGGKEWFIRARLALIAHRYGLEAAMLYKLSDGAIDPRVQP